MRAYYLSASAISLSAEGRIVPREVVAIRFDPVSLLRLY